ncbi:MAG: RsmB/NOP family class I SAM-dependent RNA methyltransferase [Promethearchaeota archaeon]
MTFDLDDATARLPLANRLSLKYSHPTFLVETLLDNLPLDSSTNLLKTSNQTRTYYIRPNTLLGSTNSVIESIVDVRAETDDSLPKVFRVVEGIDSVIRSQAYRDGQVIIQDKGSILIVDALDPKPGQIIWDTCAAPGMKTQLIAERMRGSGRIIATDVYKDRVKAGKKLSKIFNASQIEWAQADAAKPVIHTAEKILIDAPCTSTGSLQSYPSFKWRLNKESLFALMTVQNKILDAILTDYSDKPGTEIVFSTCSLLPHEGESQIDSIMKRYTIRLLTPFEYGDPGYPGFDCSKMVRRLFPHKHDCGGFFVAKFKVMQ